MYSYFLQVFMYLRRPTCPGVQAASFDIPLPTYDGAAQTKWAGAVAVGAGTGTVRQAR